MVNKQKKQLLRFLVCLWAGMCLSTCSAADAQNTDQQIKTPAHEVAKETNEQAPSPLSSDLAKIDGVPVIIAGQEVLRLKETISGFTPQQRVEAILSRIDRLEEDANFVIDNITTKDTGFSTDVVSGDNTILTITDRDAHLVGSKDRMELATECAAKLRQALVKDKEAHNPRILFFAGLYTAAATMVLLLALVALSAVFPRLYQEIRQLKGKHIKPIKIQQAELLSESSLSDIVIGFFRLIRATITTVILAIYIKVVMGFFPTTRDLSNKFVEQSVMPLLSLMAAAVTSYLPNLLMIAVIAAITYYILAFIHFIFDEIGQGSISIPDFDQEWAEPTYKIARFLIVAFALVLIFPYLPGSGSPAFQQISIFLGVLFSLGSSGAIANVVAGVFLTYTGAFKLGDRVKIADTIGDVVQRKLLYTRVRTIKHEYITIPNALVLGSHIINYSSSTSQTGLILHTSVTIAYDVPWRKVQELLLDAAMATENVLTDPPPFVFITELNPFYTTYEINAHTSIPNAMQQTYTNLNKCILDKFNEAGIEIATPDQTALRNSGSPAIPPEYLKDGPAANAFSVSVKDK